METNNNQKRLLIIAGIMVAIYVLDVVVYEPLALSWAQRAARLKTLKESLSSGQQLIKSGPALRQRWTNMMNATLKSDVSLAQSDMLKAFDRWATDSGIAVTSIQPQWKATGEDYAMLEVRADATGNIESLTKFLYNVERSHNPRDKSETEHLGVRIEDVEVSTRDENGRVLSLVLQVSGLQLGVTPDQ